MNNGNFLFHRSSSDTDITEVEDDKLVKKEHEHKKKKKKHKHHKHKKHSSKHEKLVPYFFHSFTRDVLLQSIFFSPRKHKKHKRHKSSEKEIPDREPVVRPPPPVVPVEPKPTIAPTMNGNSHKDVVINIDENSSDSDVEIKEKDSDCEINVEVLEDEMNLEDLMKQKVSFVLNFTLYFERSLIERFL